MDILKLHSQYAIHDDEIGE